MSSQFQLPNFLPSLRGAAWQRVFGDPDGLPIAVDKSFVELDTLVRQSDEVAFAASGRLA